MNPNDITINSLEALEDILANACQTIHRCRLQAENGDIGTAEAALTVAHVAEAIASFCKP